MRNEFLSSVSLFAVVFLSVNYSGGVLAHQLNGSLGENGKSTDFYQVECGAGSDHLESQIRNATTNGPLVSVQAHSGGLASNSTDAVSGGTEFSPLVSLYGGDGFYFMTVDKVGSGTVNYTVQFHCKSGNTHTDTYWVTLQKGGSINPEPQPPVVRPELIPTVIKNEVTTESESNNALVLGQGCRDQNGKVFPVIAQSVVFPTLNPVIYDSRNLEVPSTLTLGDILGTFPSAAVPESGVPGTPDYQPAIPAKAAEDITTLANRIRLIANTDLMKVVREKTDSQGNVIGFESIGGKVDATLLGEVPFMTAALPFKAGSCAKSLQVKVAVADICKRIFPPVLGSANLWMPNVTSKFKVAVDGTSATKFGGLPATLTFIRPVTGDPAIDLDETACGGPGYDVYVYPSDSDIDTNLPIQKFWGK